MKIVNNITELIGSTPMLKISAYSAPIYVKLESFNPCSSLKDRIALAMINDALSAGCINKDTVLIEATSGNTGVGLAMVAASKGMKLILAMPESMSLERRKIVSLLGAELVLTPKELGMKGAIAKAEELNKSVPNSMIVSQFDNPSNPTVHEKITAKEILKQIGTEVCDIFVAGVGTGGSISGIGKVLKNTYPNVEIVAVEPKDSAVLSGNAPGPHKIQGIGAGFIPKNLNTDVIDTVAIATYEDAISTLEHMAKNFGVLIGISGGAVMSVAIELAQKPENVGKNIVAILPDSAERYLSGL